jgi:hypothetical protein
MFTLQKRKEDEAPEKVSLDSMENGEEIIERGIPIPPRKNISILSKMEVGDSVLMKICENTVYTKIRRAVQDSGYKFTTRKMDGGYRVWRVE